MNGNEYVAQAQGLSAHVDYPEFKLTISIQKADNGYFVGLVEPPDLKAYKEARRRERQERMKKLSGSIDERIDAMVDGVVAFQKFVLDKSAGEDWKGEDMREKMREGVKVAFPGIMREITAGEPPPQARQEQMVFETKEKLLEFLTKNL